MCDLGAELVKTKEIVESTTARINHLDYSLHVDSRLCGYVCIFTYNWPDHESLELSWLIFLHVDKN